MESRQAWLGNISQSLGSWKGAVRDAPGSMVKAHPRPPAPSSKPVRGRPPEGSCIKGTLSTPGSLFWECSESKRDWPDLALDRREVSRGQSHGQSATFTQGRQSSQAQLVHGHNFLPSLISLFSSADIVPTAGVQ